ncbi:MAG TPA: hypothetical protein GYA07_06620 [Verrucomicrobia bacterium]|nr:hypothetical protein [Verrucomicrobiota bacterium]HOB31971.1 PaaX family transcriptional regulator C-terminal domain-containing protein [Verrucomicrobiota bacterium]HOP96888.1 PaaX family transcriptional regulator C-terminal domain-containing protein [Verrucomicrobiota bacterium]
MQPKTEELLYLLMWTTDVLARPTFRNLTDSFESWAYRNGFKRQIDTLARRKFLEKKADKSGDRLYRLTEEGRLHALGGRDPEARWARPWDGKWRVVVFDVPNTRNVHRERLRRYLRGRFFGYLQNSVWITPDPLMEERSILRGGDINVESLLLLDANPCAGESNAALVEASWDFPRINRRYEQCLKVLKDLPDVGARTERGAKRLLDWARLERATWLDAVLKDPLLPACLHPPSYLGPKVWARLKKVLSIARRQTEAFHL